MNSYRPPEDRTLLNYMGAVMHKSWIALTGGCTVLVLLVVIQQGFDVHVSPQWYWGSASLSILIALFQSGLEQYRQLEPHLAIGDPSYFKHYAPRTTHCYRLPISNTSKAKTIHNVTVRLISIHPRPEPYTWGNSIPLQWTHTLKPVDRKSTRL